MTEQTKAEAIREDQDDAMRVVLGNPGGRMFVWDILAQCNVFGASFTGDPLTTAFNEGRRDIGIRLLRDVLQIDPNALTKMRAENDARLKRYHVMTPTPTDEDDET